jgi:hypothetical protein
VEVHLHDQKSRKPAAGFAPAGGCPSARLQFFAPVSPCQEANQPKAYEGGPSALTHWPVQIRLVPPSAPFLKGAELLVAADCTPIAYPNFHRDFLNGKVVMVGCPKFDNADDYLHKFAEIFKVAGIKSVEVVTMEVPCCQGLPLIVKKGMELAGKKVPLQQVVISTRGELLRRQKIAP